MAARAFKQFTIAAGGTPQPLVGTSLTAAVTPTSQDVQIAVADSSMFMVGDYAVLDTDASGAHARDRVLVTVINDSTHITVRTLTYAHANACPVAVGRTCANVYIQTTQANAGPIYVGTALLNKTGQINVISLLYQMPSGQPIDWNQALPITANALELADYWVDGTTGDGYLPSIVSL